MFQGMRTVKAFRAEERELERYREINESYLRTTMKMVRAQALSHASTLFFSHLGHGGLIVLVVGCLTLSADMFRDETRHGRLLPLDRARCTRASRTSRKAVTKVQESVGAVRAHPGAPRRDSRTSSSSPSARTIARPRARHALRARELPLPGRRRARARRRSTSRSARARRWRWSGRRARARARWSISSRASSIRRAGRDHGRRPRPARPDARSWTAQYAMVGQMPFLFHTSIEREHPLRQARRDAGRDRGRGARGGHPRLHRRAARGLRDERGRHGLAPLGRPAPAHHDRARVPEGRAAAAARRGDERARQRVGGESCRRRSSG